jgi:hypothetical protein
MEESFLRKVREISVSSTSLQLVLEFGIKRGAAYFGLTFGLTK